MKKSYLNFKKASFALSFAALFFATGVKAQVSVLSTAGAVTTLANYVTLNAAFANVNNGNHQGVISMSITANTTEPIVAQSLLSSGSTSSVSYTGITIRPVGGNFTINSNATPTTNRGIIELLGADNVTIDGDDPATAGLQNLSIISAVSTATGIACIRLSSNSTTGADGANNVTIKNCIIKGARSSATSTVESYGIQFSDGAAASSSLVGAYSSINTQIVGNVITRCYYGIHAIGNSTTYLNQGLAISSNTLGSATATDNIGYRGIDVSYTEIAAVSTSSVNLNDIMMGNTAAAASPTAAVMGIEIGAGNSGLRVARNYIHDATSSPGGAYGIALTSSVSSNGVIIRNNIIRDMKGAGALTAATQSTGIGGIGIMVTAPVTGLLINNNTLAQLAAGSLGSCIQVNSPGATVAQFQNNIVTNTVASAFSYGFYTSGTINISGGTIDFNDYFIGATANLGYYNGTNASNFAAWFGATSKDANSLTGAPNFVSATNLHITPNVQSILESAGTSTANTGVGIDIDGESRPGPTGSFYGGGTAPDIGADEFDGIKGGCTQPAITITASATGTICNGTTITFTAGGATTYTWGTLNSGSSSITPISTNATVAVTPSVNTTYTVVGTNATGCSNYSMITVNVTNPVTLTAVSSAGTVCVNSTVSITGTGALTYTLSNGAANGASFAPTATGTPVYTVTGANVCGSTTKTISIQVNPLPTLTVSASTPSLCSGLGLTLTLTGSAVTFTWNGNNTFTNSTAAYTPVPGTGTSTTVSYSVTGTGVNGCTATAVNVVTVITTPVIAPLASPLHVCSGGPTTLQVNGSVALGYTWTPGGANTSSIVVVTPTVTTITPISYTVNQAVLTCTTSQVLTFSVHPLPTLFAIVNPGAVCAGYQATLTAGGATNFTWTPVTTPTTGANVIINPTVTTTYSFVGFDGTCSNSSTITVPVNAVPSLTIVPSATAVCYGSPVTLTGTGAQQYTWTSSTSTMSTINAQIVDNPTVVTSYNAIGQNAYVVAGNGYTCVGYAGQVIFVNPLPTLTINPTSTVICAGRTITLTASSIGSGPQVTYQWDGNANNATTAGVAITPANTTIFTVLGQYATTGCITSKSAVVNVFNPAFTAPTSTEVCSGTTVALVSSGANSSYTWLPSGSHAANITVSPSGNTTYSVIGASTVQNGAGFITCAAQYVFTVTVNPNPTVTATASRTVMCRGENVTLMADGANTYTWNPAPDAGSGATVTVNSVDVPNYVNSRTYTLTGADTHHCKAKATITIFSSGCVGIQQQSASEQQVMIYPNPNNGEFTITSSENITLTIVNELGQSVKTLTLTESNNRNASVSEMSNGIYFIVGANANGSVKQKIIIAK